MNIFAQSTATQDLAASSNEEAAVLLFVFLFVIMTAIAGYIARSIALAYIFKKAGQTPWKAWVPVYNQWIMLQLGGQKGYWSVLMLVPFVNIAALVMTYIAMYHIGLKLQKQPVFVLLAIFITFVWYVWLAVDASKWDDSASEPRRDTVSPAKAA